jgi:basic membrane protein A
MGAVIARRTAVLALCALLFLPLAFGSCDNTPSRKYRVGVIGFSGDRLNSERQSLVEYGARRIEAELGAEVDVLEPGGGRTAELFSEGEGAYDMVVSMGVSSSREMLTFRTGDTGVQAVALDFSSPQPLQGEGSLTLVRYRVEEGAYLCGFLAGWLTGRKDHPLANPRPDVAFIGAADDPLLPYYDIGFSKGVRAALSKPGIYRYTVTASTDSKSARAYAEHAARSGVDIIFCSPGAFDSEVLKVAQEKNLLVILVGADRYQESPEHVLTSLVLRDDNALFEAVSEAMEGRLKPGQWEWGRKENIWSLAPFHGHDAYIRKELKEALQEQEEGLGSVDFSS